MHVLNMLFGLMTTRLNKRYYYYYYTVFQKSDAKIQITITTAFLKQLLLRNFEVDFLEICNIYIGKMIIKAAKRIFNSDKMCRSYNDLNFGVTFFGTQCILMNMLSDMTNSSRSHEEGER